jgi:hypothetical protein
MRFSSLSLFLSLSLPSFFFFFSTSRGEQQQVGQISFVYLRFGLSGKKRDDIRGFIVSLFLSWDLDGVL